MEAVNCFSTTTSLLPKHNNIKKNSSSFGFDLRPQSSFQPKFSKLVASYNNIVKPLHCSSHTRSSSLTSTAIKPADHDQERDGSVTLDVQPENELKKQVHVKFVLEKACLFGEQIMIVGDDPMLGVWDPKDAVPLQWSDGHLWTAELDIAVGKSIQYKFLVKGVSGEVTWQSGPDRIVRIWDTSKTIVVSEDWENAMSQKLTEQEEEEEEKVIREEVKSSVKAEDVVEKTADEKKNLERLENNKNVVTKEKQGLSSKPKSASVFKHAVNGSNMEALLSNDVPVKCNLS